MIITTEKLNSFYGMINDFAIEHDLTLKMETMDVTSKKYANTIIKFVGNKRARLYVVRWSEFENLDDAVTSVFGDALAYFEIKTNSKTHDFSFDISKVIFNGPATIVFWKDGTKTVVKCQEGDCYSEETGLALCFMKKALGNKPNFNNVFRKWIPENDEITNNQIIEAFKQLFNTTLFKMYDNMP